MPASNWSTTQYIAHFARQLPNSVAVRSGDSSASYRELAIRIVQFTRALEDLGARRGMLVGIACEDRMLHLLLILACELIGAPSVSLTPTELQWDNRLLQRCELVLVSRPRERFTAQRTHLISPEWLRTVFAADVDTSDWACLERAPQPGQVVRITRTSGTTARPKCMENSHRIQALWIERRLDLIRDRSLLPLTFLCWKNSTNRTVHLTMRMALQTGGLVVLTSPDRFARDCAQFERIYVHTLLRDAEMLLRGLPADFRRPAACYLKGFAGVLPGSLRKRLMEKIASELCCTYGCNETGNIALIGEDGIGTLLAGVEAAVIDESGAGKPHGEVCLIKVKTDTMVQVDRSADRNSIRARLPGVVPADLGVVHFLLSETLPRTQNGKLIKRDIEAQLRKSLGR